LVEESKFVGLLDHRHRGEGQVPLVPNHMHHLRLVFPVASRHAIFRVSSRRYASSAPEVYLQRDSPKWPEIAVLRLNRPQAKNAISRRLLKVNRPYAVALA
jgi:hypothetical protein